MNLKKTIATTFLVSLFCISSQASASACSQAQDNLRATIAQYGGSPSSPITPFGRFMIGQAQNQVTLQCESTVFGGGE